MKRGGRVCLALALLGCNVRVGGGGAEESSTGEMEGAEAGAEQGTAGEEDGLDVGTPDLPPGAECVKNNDCSGDEVCFEFDCFAAYDLNYELRVEHVDSSGGNNLAHEYWVSQASALLEVSLPHFPDSGPLEHWAFPLPPRDEDFGAESGPAPATEIEIMRLPLDQVQDEERLKVFEVSLDGPSGGVPVAQLHAGEWILPEYDSPNSITITFTPVSEAP